MTTCPSGVNYMHLVDHGRHHIEETLHAPVARSPAARLLGVADAAAGACSAGPWCWAGSPSRWRCCCRRAAADPGGATFLRRLKAMLEAVPDRLAGPVAGRSAADLSRGGTAPQARGADAGLRPAGAGARGQRGDGAAADAPRHRGGERRGLGLLRLVGPAYRPERARRSSSPSATSRRGCARSRRRSRRHRHQRLGLRHHGEGLRPHVRRRSGLEGEGPAGGAARQGCQRGHAGRRSRERDRAAAHRGLSFGLFHAARPEGDRATQEAAARRGLHRQGRARGASLLRLGRHLSGAAARAVAPPARPQGRQHRERPARRHRRRQFRLHRQYRARAPAFRLRIPSNCSTGRPAGPSRRPCQR